MGSEVPCPNFGFFAMILLPVLAFLAGISLGAMITTLDTPHGLDRDIVFLRIVPTETRNLCVHLRHRPISEPISSVKHEWPKENGFVKSIRSRSRAQKQSPRNLTSRAKIEWASCVSESEGVEARGGAMCFPHCVCALIESDGLEGWRVVF